MDLSIRDAILLLRKNGYTVTPPEEEEVTDEYSFEKAWDLYQKKVGPKEKLRAKWNKLPLKDLPNIEYDKEEKEYEDVLIKVKDNTDNNAEKLIIANELSYVNTFKLAWIN